MDDSALTKETHPTLHQRRLPCKPSQDLSTFVLASLSQASAIQGLPRRRFRDLILRWHSTTDGRGREASGLRRLPSRGAKCGEWTSAMAWKNEGNIIVLRRLAEALLRESAASPRLLSLRDNNPLRRTLRRGQNAGFALAWWVGAGRRLAWTWALKPRVLGTWGQPAQLWRRRRRCRSHMPACPSSGKPARHLNQRLPRRTFELDAPMPADVRASSTRCWATSQSTRADTLGTAAGRRRSIGAGEVLLGQSIVHRSTSPQRACPRVVSDKGRAKRSLAKLWGLATSRTSLE